MKSSGSPLAPQATEKTLIISLSANKTKRLNSQADALPNETESHSPKSKLKKVKVRSAVKDGWSLSCG